MALSKNYAKEIFGQTIIFNNAYIAINKIEGNKNFLNITVIIYDEAKQNVVETKYFSFVPSIDDSSANFYKQGYEYMKTTEELSGSVDVLEEGQSA